MSIIISNRKKNDTDDLCPAVFGKLFDLYLPASEQYHREQLTRLRNDRNVQRVQIEGFLKSKLGVSRDIFWIHAPFYREDENQEAFVLSMGVDIGIEHIAERKLLDIANFDPVTGLGNRRNFESELAGRLASAKRLGGQGRLADIRCGAGRTRRRMFR